jgi:S-formylglutathione hydrolase FrmB
MTLTLAEEGLGPPWQRPLRGRLDQLVVDSETLARNPLGDPARRPLYVYCSPGVRDGLARDVPSVYVLQGFTGQLDAWLARSAFEPTVVERLDAMFAGEQPPVSDAVIVFVDAWTSLGGSQFVNSSAIGDYSDYICDEVVPFIDSTYPTAAAPQRRGVAGKSSGGYGAMVLAMRRPDIFGALVSHAGDALFEACYLADIHQAARVLRDQFDGSLETFWQHFAARERFDFGRFGAVINVYAMACAYSPDPDHPTRPLLPFELRSGRLIPEVWERWLAQDPVRMVPAHAAALQGLRHIHIEAGRADEFFLDLGAQAVSQELERAGIEHTFELFDGSHGGLGYRYAPAIRDLLAAL